MKRIAALAGVILFVALALLTLIFAITNHPYFKASLAAVILVPALAYAYLLIYRLLKQKGQELANEENTKKED